MNGNETCVTALHYATHVNKKKNKWHFRPLLHLRPTPISLPGLGKMPKCKGPLVSPKVTVHSATVNNSKNVASAKVNIFYSEIPSAWWSAMVPLAPRDVRHTCSPGRAAWPQRGGAPPLALHGVWIHPL